MRSQSWVVIAGVGGFDGQPMLMGAMVMGPFAGWVIKKFDKAMDGHMPAGFEMLINNFSVGILGMIRSDHRIFPDRTIHVSSISSINSRS